VRRRLHDLVRIGLLTRQGTSFLPTEQTIATNGAHTEALLKTLQDAADKTDLVVAQGMADGSSPARSPHRRALSQAPGETQRVSLRAADGLEADLSTVNCLGGCAASRLNVGNVACARVNGKIEMEREPLGI
jgi:hypothetical protein